MLYVKQLSFTLASVIVLSWTQAQAQSLELTRPPCLVGNMRVGYIEGQDQALFDSLVSKAPKEQLTPLAIPSPIRPLPIEYLNPKHQAYYKKINRTEYLQEEAAISAMTMIRKAYEQGLRLWIHSAYRSYEQQCHVFRSKVDSELKKGMELKEAIKFVNLRSAFPGESEHQLGTTVDLVSDHPQLDYGLKFDFAKTNTYQWLLENAAEYGFVLSFPAPEKGGVYEPHPETKIVFEPWHWRYIGKKWAYQYKTCSDKMPPQEFLRRAKQNPEYTCS